MYAKQYKTVLCSFRQYKTEYIFLAAPDAYLMYCRLKQQAQNELIQPALLCNFYLFKFYRLQASSAAWPSGSEGRFYDNRDRKVDGSTPTQALFLRP